MVIPWTLFGISGLTYVFYSYFLDAQMRAQTAIFEIATIIISAFTSIFCVGYFEIDEMHNLCLLIVIILCVSLSKLTHFYSMITSALICICHICVFHWMFAEIPCVYIMCLSGSFLLSSWFSYRIEYKLRELFIIALAFEQDQLSITKELTQLLPGFVIERMIGTQQNNKIVDRFNNATIFQSDLVGFTKFCSTKSPSEIVIFLNELYVQLDELCVAFGLE